MTTAIAKWGNSTAVRIPQSVLQAASMRNGDSVSFRVLGPGRIEVITSGSEHRRVAPAKGITFEALFADWDAQQPTEKAWPSEDMVGAEWDAWSN